MGAAGLTKYEGTNTPKKTFITEFGWETTNSANANGVSQAVQDTNLVTSFSAIKATPYVQMAIWFSLAGQHGGWPLVRSAGFDGSAEAIVPGLPAR